MLDEQHSLGRQLLQAACHVRMCDRPDRTAKQAARPRAALDAGRLGGMKCDVGFSKSNAVRKMNAGVALERSANWQTGASGGTQKCNTSFHSLTKFNFDDPISPLLGASPLFPLIETPAPAGALAIAMGD